MLLSSGTLLQGGKYKIERVLGQGGFGITYLASLEIESDQLLGKIKTTVPVTVKEFFMKEYCLRDPATAHVSVGSQGALESVGMFRRKFVKEAQMLASLKHPHIVKIYDVFEENGTAYYVMEYIDGGSLRERVEKEGAMPESEALTCVHQIADALRYLHDHQMTHLDVKPGNIMLRSTGEAVLIDFGLSKRYDDEGRATSTTPVGISHGYAPMEQYKQGGVNTFSPVTDIYSLGATLYKLVTGLTPPEAMVVNDEGLPAMPAGVSPLVRNAVVSAMRPRQKDRPQSIESFVMLLDESTAVNPKSRPLPSTPPEPEKPSEPEPKKNRSLLPVLIAAGVIIGVLIGFFVMRGLRYDGRDGNIVAQTEIADSDSIDHSVVEPAEDNAAVRKAEEERLAKEKREREAAEKAEAERKAKEQREAAEKTEAERKTKEQREAAEKAEAERKAREAAEAKRREEEQKRNSVNIEMVYVAGGTFMMGATSEQGSDAAYDEKPAHNVTVSSFYIGKYEVTQKQWVEIMGSNPSYFKGDNLPVEQVSWNDIQDFIKKLNAKTGKNYRLPTEAEWEFAARGGNNSRGYKYSGSNTLSNVAWYTDNSGSKTHPVGTKSPNELGIYDMSGNVNEWCSDWYGSYSSNSRRSSGSYRVMRGGSWGIHAWSCRVSYRGYGSPGDRYGSDGFRLAMDAR